MGIKEFSQRVHGMDELQSELKKINVDSKSNRSMAVTGIIIAALSLIVSIIALFKS